MPLKKIIREISQHEDIVEYPPVLIDIGASKELNPHWRQISHISVCILFDADERDFSYEVQENTQFKKLVKVNKIVVSQSKETKKTFYLTNSPYCSSLLEPNMESLENYNFSELFKVINKSTIETIYLPTLLDNLSLKYIDWFKADSQGTDLRLFKSLNESIQQKIIVLEFEPGFIDAYKDEDKIVDCLNFLKNKKDFFLTRFEVKGPMRIPSKLFDSIFKNRLQRNLVSHIYKKVPGWAEMTYMNDLKDPDSNTTARDFILAWLFSTLEGHHEIAYVYAVTGIEKFSQEKIFIQLEKYSLKKLKYSIYSLSNFQNIISLAMKKYFG